VANRLSLAVAMLVFALSIDLRCTPPMIGRVARGRFGRG
jgi:hypothetical protein